MKSSILFAYNDSRSSRAALNFLVNLPLCMDNIRVTLLHVFRKPSGGEELMGENYLKNEVKRVQKVMEDAMDQLISYGCHPKDITIEMLDTPFPTIADGIIDYFKKSNEYEMIIIGRKKMSKAEEFVLGDVGVKLVRVLEGVAVMVVKG